MRQTDLPFRRPVGSGLFGHAASWFLLALAASQPGCGRLLEGGPPKWLQRPGAGSDRHDRQAEFTRGGSAPDDGRFAAALHSPSASVRLEALRAWQDAEGTELPDAVVRLRADADPRVRAAVLELAARQRHPQAHHLISAALADYDSGVRLAAIRALGKLGGDDARATLEDILQSDREILAEAAVPALATMGADEAVLQAAEHSSWRVRRAAAQSLAGFATPNGAAVARRLVEEDPSGEVHRAVLAAIADWPLALSGQALLAAMAKRSPELRTIAAEQLAAKWPPAREFPLYAPADEQAAALASLRERYLQEIRPICSDAPARGLAAAQRFQQHRPTPESVAEVTSLLDHAGNPDFSPAEQRWALRRLIDFGPELPRIVEHLAVDQRRVMPDWLWRDVMPRYGPEFVALDELTSDEVTVRRRAAGKLASLVGERPLGRLVTARLVWQMSTEQDHLVWVSALKAVAEDPGRAAAQLAVAGCGHPSPEVRRRACAHLGAHPAGEHGRVLLGLLRDPSHAVVVAALEALAAGERLDDPAAVEPLLGRPEETVRLRAAIVLARFGHASGREALKRLAWSEDVDIRAGAAAAMGQLADPQYAATLIRLLDDRTPVRRAALAALPLVAGQDVAAASAPSSTSMSEQVQLWKQWWQDRSAGGGRR